MRATLNDKFRQHIIEYLGTQVSANKLWLVLSLKDDGTINAGKVATPREPITILNGGGATIKLVKQVDLDGDDLLYFALTEAESDPLDPDLVEVRVGNQKFYHHKNMGLESGNKLWTTIYGEIMLPQNDNMAPTYYNIVAFVLADEDQGNPGEPLLDNTAILITHTYINKTTLPYELGTPLKTIIRL